MKINRLISALAIALTLTVTACSNGASSGINEETTTIAGEIKT